MAISYPYTLPDGYFHGKFQAGLAVGVEDYGLLPANSVYVPPVFIEGYWPRWPLEDPGATDWEQVEDHKGKEGYVNGERATIKDYGPLPDGWSDTPPPPTFAEALAAKLGEVMAGYGAAFADMEKIYPQHEREGWPLQEAEALAVMADPQANTPVLSALVQLRGRGESVVELAAKVLANAASWRMYYAWYTGQQQRMYAEVSALADVAAIQAYQVAYLPPPAQE